MSLVSKLNKIEQNVIQSKWRLSKAQLIWQKPTRLMREGLSNKQIRHNISICYMAVVRWEKYFESEKNRIYKLMREI